MTAMSDPPHGPTAQPPRSPTAQRLGPTRITRIIARLNIGGPAIQAITLTRELAARGYETRLVRGSESVSEGSMDYLAARLGVTPTLIGALRRDPGRGDLVALWRLVRILRADRPAIVHTHAAKAGTLGRLATLIAYPRRSTRPVLIHTFHGHSLTGYFSSRTARFYRLVEQVLARSSDLLIAVSPEVRDELVALGVAPAEKFTVVPLGFDLSPFTDDRGRAERRAALRAQLGVRESEQLVTLIARVVPIKRVDRFLRVARLLADRPQTRFAIVGDGELREQLAASMEARALGEKLIWTGFRRDIADVCFASDIVMLTSDNEGTPVSLIEAQAAGVPVIGTDVGGVRSAVRDGISGYVVAPGDEAGLAAAARDALDDPPLLSRLGAEGRRHATSAHALARLVENHDRIYRRLLAER